MNLLTGLFGNKNGAALTDSPTMKEGNETMFDHDIAEIKKSKNGDDLFADTNSAAYRRSVAWHEAQVKRARKEGMFGVVATITPEYADYLLSRNISNRALKQKNLTDIITDITAGRWELNGETVIIDEPGDLSDGQHRCKGVVVAGRPIKVLMAFGAGARAKFTTDIGAAKSAGDFLGMDGMPDQNHVARVANLIWQIETLGAIVNSRTSGPRVRATKAQIQEVAAKHIHLIQRSMKAVSKANSRKIGAWSNLVAAHLLLARIDQDQATAFLSALISGEGLTRSNPAFVARERLTDMRGRRQTSPDAVVQTIIRAWNAMRENRRITKIQLGSWVEAI